MATIKRIDGKETTQLTLGEYSDELATGPQATRADRVGELVIDIADPAYPVVYVVNDEGNVRAIAPGNTPNAAGGNGQIQFNADGQMAASPNLFFDPVTHTLVTTELAVTGTVVSDLVPLDTDTFNLGTPTNRWNEVNAAIIAADDAQIGNLTVGNLNISNLAVNQLVNGNSNVSIQPNADITMSVNSVSNIVVVSDTGTTFTGIVDLGDIANLTIAGGSNNQFLRTDGNGLITWSTTGAGAAGGNRQVQYNNDGNLNASNTFLFDPVDATLTVSNLALTDSVASNLEPIDDNVFDLGASLYRWRNLHTIGIFAEDATIGNLTIANITGLSSIGNGNSVVQVLANSDIVMAVNGVSNVMVVSDVVSSIKGDVLLGNTISISGDDTTFTGNVALGDVANVHINGGIVGQVLTTDGLGNLQWVTGIAGANSFGNGTSNGIVETANANIVFNVNSVPNVLVISDDAATFRGNVDVAGNITTANLTLLDTLFTVNANISANLTVLDARFTGNVNLGNVANLRIAGGNATQVLSTDGSGVLYWSNGAGGTGFANGLSNGNIQTANGDITFAVNGVANVVVIGDSATTIAGNLDVREHLYANNATVVANIDVGNLDVAESTVSNNLSVASNLVANNANFTGLVNLGVIGNVSIAGGNPGEVVSTDGNGLLTWANVGESGAFSNGLSKGSIPTANGNILFTVDGTPNVVVITAAGLTITGNTSTGNLVATGNILAGNANVTGNLIAGNANILANLTSSNANITTFLTAANANVTGNLIAGNATVAGSIIGNNITALANISAGNIAITDDITANNANFTGNLAANYAAFTEDITANNITLVSNITAFSGSFGGNVDITDALSANAATIIANLSAGNITAVGNIDANNAVITANTTTGNITVASRLTTANAIVSANLTAANANITATLTANVATVTGNLQSGNAVLGNTAIANYFIGDGSLLSNIGGAGGTFKGSYSFASPSPLLIGLVSIGTTITNATLVVVTPFNDPATTLSLGDTNNANSLLSTTDSVPTATGSYGAITVVQYGSDTQILLTIDPGTSTQGDGIFNVSYQ